MNVHRILGVFCILLALAANATAAPAVTTGLMAYYSFDNPNNITADGSGHGYNGTIPTAVTGVTAATGRIGGAVNFDNYRDGTYVEGAAPDYMNLPGASMNPSGLTNFSFAGYFKPSGQKRDTQWMIISGYSSAAQGLDSAPDLQFRYYDFTYGPTSTDYSMQTRLRNELGQTSANIIDQKVNTAPLTEWAHWAFTYDKNGGETAFNMYRNGENVYSGPLLNTTDMMGSWTAGNMTRVGHPDQTQSSLRLGAAANDQTLGYGGLMDEVYLFNQTLTANQIGTLYNAAYLPGDANRDGTTDATDLNTVLSFYNQSGKGWTGGDFNSDGATDATDLNTVLSYYNQSLGGSLQAVSSAVPEPSSIIMLATLSALVGAWTIRRRSR